jgi:hypothetical protein
MTIDSADDPGDGSSIAIDSNDKVHISYNTKTSSLLKYTTNMNGTWEQVILDSTRAGGNHTALAVDKNNKAHISYYDVTETFLKYATNSSGFWKLTLVDSAANKGYATSIALDHQDKIFIGYQIWTASDLKLATFGCGTVCTKQDKDGDGYIDVLCGGNDCNDDNALVYPDCAGKECGDDECGGSCGICLEGNIHCQPAIGKCVQCLNNSHCLDPVKPICSQTSFTCKGCTSNPECAPLTCETATGKCI